jgi:hypothetical protein
VRIPTFSRQSDTTTEDERPTAVSSSTATPPERTDTPPPVRPRNSAVTTPARAGTTRWNAPPPEDRGAGDRDDTIDLARPSSAVNPRPAPGTDPGPGRAPVPGSPVPAGPKPRSSLLATLGLILGVAAALLVLSGPLLGYGIGVAAVGLILSVAGLRATRRRHVAGKTDALIGLVLALGAIVVGVLALNGSLAWAGTDIQPVTSLREWLDAHLVNRF